MQLPVSVGAAHVHMRGPFRASTALGPRKSSHFAEKEKIVVNVQGPACPVRLLFGSLAWLTLHLSAPLTGPLSAAPRCFPNLHSLLKCGRQGWLTQPLALSPSALRFNQLWFCLGGSESSLGGVS